MGLYVNTLPVVLRPEPDLTPLQLMERARQFWSELRSHENSPHDLVLEATGLPGDQPLFQTLVGYEKYQLSEYISSLGGPLADSCFELRGFTDIPLAIQLFRGERFLIEGVYREDRLSGQSAQRLVGYLQKALSNMASHPARPICRIQFLDTADRRAIRKNARLARNASSPISSVVAAFEGAASSRPDAAALAWEGRVMNYRTLNEMANRLARWLRRRGLKSGERVGILVGRDHWGPLACLAVLKCGAVYVPFDPEYPKDRLRWMAKDADIKFALLGPGISCPPSLSKAKVVDLEQSWPAIQRCSAENLNLDLSPDRAAYLMYTSGSTGKPKGVVIPHRGITRLVLRPDYVSLNSRSRTLQLAPVSFDAATFEIWGPLLNGGVCAIYPERVPTLDGLEAALRQYRVNTLWLTASLFNFVVSAKPKILRGVRQILTGGEALSPSHVRRGQLALPDCALINGYGPTENTTFSCCHAIPRLQPKDEPVPIGRPIRGSTAHVLDRHLQPCPVGVAGELYVGGLGVGLGYHKRPKLTRQRFLENPFGPGLLYRTGDQARLRADGVLEFL